MKIINYEQLSIHSASERVLLGGGGGEFILMIMTQDSMKLIA